MSGWIPGGVGRRRLSLRKGIPGNNVTCAAENSERYIVIGKGKHIYRISSWGFKRKSI